MHTLRISVEYEKNQDPYLIITGECEHSGPSLIALSGDGRAVGIATGSHLALYNAATGHCEQKFEDVFNGKFHVVLIRAL